ncbi:hypothetical protein NE237_023694 [Protea cynaroides]|uniref:Uncharacterized protein n=1 Tax=Protea cynaroides TaxID=273540 RepID=A0A9Q0K6B6_9MAGN|nr:hypothetical protein NE237_023694 [Protea cynaroides]
MGLSFFPRSREKSLEQVIAKEYDGINVSEKNAFWNRKPQESLTFLGDSVLVDATAIAPAIPNEYDAIAADGSMEDDCSPNLGAFNDSHPQQTKIEVSASLKLDASTRGRGGNLNQSRRAGEQEATVGRPAIRDHFSGSGKGLGEVLRGNRKPQWGGRPFMTTVAVAARGWGRCSIVITSQWSQLLGEAPLQRQGAGGATYLTFSGSVVIQRKRRDKIYNGRGVGRKRGYRI